MALLLTNLHQQYYHNHSKERGHSPLRKQTSQAGCIGRVPACSVSC